MNRILLGLLIIPLYFSNAQDLTCKDFRKGTFIVNTKSPETTIKIVRNGNEQVENLIKASEEYIETNPTEVVHAKLNWINDCSYHLLYDSAKMKLGEVEKYINDNGGVLVEVTKIEGQCFYYKTTMTVNGKELGMEGKICKE